MDCCICSPMIAVYRPPRNTICPRCYEGARCMVDFFKGEKDGSDNNGSDIGDREATTSVTTSQLLRENRPNSSMGMAEAFKRVKELKEKEERMSERLGFAADSLVAAFKDGIHTDILVQPRSGPAIPAHRALLATKSPIFQTMLSSDECKAPANDTISLAELTHLELQCLLEFLYSGTLNPEYTIVDEHMCLSLLIAADKYDIPFLTKICEARIPGSLGPSNALHVLEVAETCSNTYLKEKAMRSIVEHMEDVVLSAAYDAFALKNAHLCVEITRALLTEAKAKRDDTFNVE